MDRSADILEKARGVLLEDSTPVSGKVECLKRLIQAGYGPLLRPLIREAAGWPANQALLKDLVRAYGFTGDQSAIFDLAPYFRHHDKSIVCNALKAAIDLDPTQAVRLGVAAVKDARPQVALPVALLLSRQCEPSCRDFFLGLSYSQRERDRIAALVYLRSRPPEESVPVVLDMIRRERDTELRAQLNRLLARRIPKRNAQVLAELRSELVAKIAEIDELAASLPAELDPTWRGSAQALMARLVQELPPEPPPPAAPPRGPVKASGRLASPPPEPIAPTGERGGRNGMAALLTGAVVLAIGAATIGLGSKHPPAAAGGEVKTASALGNPGTRVEVSGKLVEVDRTRRTLTLHKGTSGTHWTVIVRWLDVDVSGLVVNRSTAIDGILTEIRPGDVYVVQGLSATQ